MLFRVLLFIVLIARIQIPVTPAPILPTSTPTPNPVLQVTPNADDARASVCSAYTLPDFQPIVVQAGDTIATLLGDDSVLTVTQAAALNCLDDPNNLPIGAVIWLPIQALDGTAEPDASCDYEWMAGIENTGCAPELARLSSGAVQFFEGGMMIWFADSNLIYVMTQDDGHALIFEDTFREGDLDPVAAPPERLIAPVRGFGKIWAFLGGDTSPLGWALVPESGTDISLQAAGRSSYTTYVAAGGELYAISEYPGLEYALWLTLESANDEG